MAGSPRRSSKIGGYLQSKLPMVKKQKSIGSNLWRGEREWEKNSQPFPHKYVKPKPLPNTPDYDNDADKDEKREARADLDIKWRNYAVVQGFIQHFQDNIQGAVESRLCQDLEHIRFGFDNVWPKEFLDKIKSYCPLDVQAIKEAKAHFARS